jgi:toxin ParE1/3/4
MKSYRLSPQAEQTLEDIIGWTIDHFGVDQAVKYKDQLIARLSSLAVDEVPHGRPCNVLLAGKRDVGDLEYYREGRHTIIYRNTDEAIFVLDFIHGSRNLEAIIEDLSELS